MKVQEVILRAMAGRSKWWEAAGIVCDRTMRAGGNATRSTATMGVRAAQTSAQPEAGPAEDGGKGAATVSIEVFRFQRAALSREAGGRSRPPAIRG
jgi:hypothetical protein